MGKDISKETLKVITTILFLLCICLKVSAQSPYAIFGDNSKMLEAKSEAVPSIYCIRIHTFNGEAYYVDFNLNKGVATLYDLEGNVL